MIESIHAAMPPPLTWDEISKRIQLNHPELQKSDLAVQSASQNYALELTDSAPNINATLSTSQDLYSGNGSGLSESLTVSQSIFPTFFERPNVDRSRLLISKSQLDRALVNASIRYSIATDYINLWAAEQSVELAQKIVARRKKNLALVGARFEAGREHAGSKKWANAQYASAMNELEQSKRQVTLYRHILSVQLSGFEIGDLATQLPNSFLHPPTTPNIQLLSKTHPLIQSAGIKVQIAHHEKNTVAWDYLPSLSAALSSSQSGPLSGTRTPATDIGVRAQLTIPLYSGNANLWRTELAMTAIESTHQDYLLTQRTVVSDLLTGWNAVQNASDDLRVQNLFYSAAQTRSEIAGAQYGSGLLSYESWDLIETEVVNQMRQVLGRQKALALAIANWDRIQGKGIEQ